MGLDFPGGQYSDNNNKVTIVVNYVESLTNDTSSPGQVCHDGDFLGRPLLGGFSCKPYNNNKNTFQWWRRTFYVFSEV